MSLLELGDVTKSFGGVRALEGVSLEVNEAAIVGLIGPNGAGKTTLFNIVSGQLLIDARPCAHRRAALGIGRSFQNLGLMLDETVAFNVMTALHRSAPYTGPDVILRPWLRNRGERALEQRCARALQRFGLLGDRERRVRDLPFARARFAELAAVTAEAPRLMLLDEPTTGLDLAEVSRLDSVLGELRGDGTTILLVAHDVRFVMGVCDYVYVLAEGRMLAQGEPRTVQSHPAVVEAYLGKTA